MTDQEDSSAHYYAEQETYEKGQEDMRTKILVVLNDQFQTMGFDAESAVLRNLTKEIKEIKKGME